MSGSWKVFFDTISLFLCISLFIVEHYNLLIIIVVHYNLLIIIVVRFVCLFRVCRDNSVSFFPSGRGHD